MNFANKKHLRLILVISGAIALFLGLSSGSKTLDHISQSRKLLDLYVDLNSLPVKGDEVLFTTIERQSIISKVNMLPAIDIQLSEKTNHSWFIRNKDKTIINEQIKVLERNLKQQIEAENGWLKIYGFTFLLFFILGIYTSYDFTFTQLESKEIFERFEKLSKLEKSDSDLITSALHVFVQYFKTDVTILWLYKNNAMRIENTFSDAFELSTDILSRNISIGVEALGETWLNAESHFEKSKLFPECHSLYIPVTTSSNEVIGLVEIHAKKMTWNPQNHKLYDKLGNSFGRMVQTYRSNIQLRTVNSLLSSQKQALDSAAIVAETDAKGRITYVNDKFVQISKFPREELIGQDHRILNSKHHPPSFFQNLWKAIAKGHVWNDEICNRAKDGSLYWVDTTIYPVIGANGHVQKYTAIRFDISDRKHIEEKLRGATASIIAQKQALDSAAIVAETDASGKITYVNSKFIEISGYEKAELIGQDHRLLNSKFHEKSFFIDLWRKISSGEVWHGEVKNKKKNGEFYWVATTIYPVKDHNNKLVKFVAIRFDITARKELEFSLIEAKDRAQQAINLKTHILDTVSHEIRTPLNGIIGFTDMLLANNLPEDSRKSLDIIKHCGENLYSLINDYLDFSKIEANKLVIEKTDTNIRDIVKNTVSLFSRQLEQKGINLEYHIDQNVSHTVNSDPKRIEQILTNLVSNAIKFTDHGSIKVLVQQKPKNSKKNIANLIISVSDTGLGIEKNNINRLFESFQQADKSTTRRFGGTGLGLAICKKLVHLMNGSISAESELGKGSTFSFEIEIEVIDAVRQTEKLANSIENKSRKPIDKKMKVLVVEDNQTNIELISKYLELHDLHPKVAINGEDGYKLAKTEVFDLILLDLNMPIMDGWIAAKKIRTASLNRCTTIIALTAANKDNITKRCYESGFNSILLKPLKRITLTKTLESTRLNPSHLPSINYETLKSRFPDREDKETLEDIANSFSETYNSNLAKIKASIQADNSDEIRAAAHELKGVISNFSFDKSERLLQTLEDHAQDDDMDGCLLFWALELEDDLKLSMKLLLDFLKEQRFKLAS